MVISGPRPTFGSGPSVCGGLAGHPVAQYPEEKCGTGQRELGQLLKERVDLIARAAQEVVDGRWGGESPAKMLGLPQDMTHPLGGRL
jgi:hypothetical protein